MSGRYHLIRVRDGAYWRPEGQGYTGRVSDAGLFMEQYAREVVADTHGDVAMVEYEEGSSISVKLLDDALEDAIIMGRDDTDYVSRLKACRAYLRKHGTLEIRS